MAMKTSFPTPDGWMHKYVPQQLQGDCAAQKEAQGVVKGEEKAMNPGALVDGIESMELGIEVKTHEKGHKWL
jgi:hypothetical protein